MTSGGTPSGHRVSYMDHMMIPCDHMIHDVIQK